MTIITEHINLNYSLIFEAPFHFGTGLRRGLIHRTVARDHQEYLIVPGTSIKGVVRERCEQLGKVIKLHVVEPHDTPTDELRLHGARMGDPDIIARIFGSRFRAGQLFFDDAAITTIPFNQEAAAEKNEGSPPVEYIDRSYFDGHDKQDPGKYILHQVETRTQVSLSRLTRTAKTGQLYTSEYGIRELRFDGRIYGYLRGFRPEAMEYGTYSLLLLAAGLQSIDRMGGQKSTGAVQVQVEITRLIIDGQSVQIGSFLKNLPEIEYYFVEREEKKT